MRGAEAGRSSARSDPGHAASDRAKRPSVAAVVLNHNGEQRVLNTIEALRRQPELETIVVVDNDSEDGSPQRIVERFPDVELLDMGGNMGIPVARNRGLQHVDTDLVLLIDDDVYLERDCLSRMITALVETGAAVVCPRIRLHPQRDMVQADGAAAHFVGTMILRHAFQPVDTLPNERQEVDGCIGACMLLDRRLVVAAGGFDELYFFYFEDLEFSVRLRAMGHRFVLEPTAEVFHDRGRGTPGLSFRGTEASYPTRRAYFTLRHRILTLSIHYRLRSLVVLAPALMLYELAVLATVVRRGWVREWVRVWWWHLSNRREIRSRRTLAQSRRVVRDRDLLVAGPLPLAQGFAQSRLQTALIGGLSVVLDVYWTVTRRLVG